VCLCHALGCSPEGAPVSELAYNRRRVLEADLMDELELGGSADSLAGLLARELPLLDA